MGLIHLKSAIQTAGEVCHRFSRWQAEVYLTLDHPHVAKSGASGVPPRSRKQ